MRTSRRKILGALIASLVILVGAAFAVAKFNRGKQAKSIATPPVQPVPDEDANWLATDPTRLFALDSIPFFE